MSTRHRQLLKLAAVILSLSLASTSIRLLDHLRSAPHLFAATLTVNLKVASSGDDAHELNNDTEFSSTFARIRMDKSSVAGVQYTGAFRFANVAVPKGAVIDAATFRCFSDMGSWDDPAVTLYAEQIDSSPNFKLVADVVHRVKTAHSVSWSASNLGIGYHAAPSVGSVIQEVVDRPNWRSGNALVLLLKGISGTVDFRCSSYDGDATQAATLSITYHLANPTLTPVPTPLPAPTLTPTPIPPLETMPPPEPSPVPEPTATPSTRPNILVIETDDQRPDIDLSTFMPSVKGRIVDQGMLFTNAYTTTSLCCPSRSSFLTGQYAHNHGVWSTLPPNGGVYGFHDSSSLATWLKSAGYTTSLAGKYLIGYMASRAPAVPPGWDDFHALDGGYYGFSLSENGAVNSYPSSQYSTDVLRDKTINFVQNAIAAGQPFFAWFVPYAPHAKGNYPAPPVPAVRHQGTCDGIPPYRPPSFNEADVSDKPAPVKYLPLMNATAISNIDTFRRAQLCALKAEDEAVDAILNALGPELDNTIVIFTSDNGFMWGEHRRVTKDYPYEESIRVPLAIRYPPLIGAGTTSDKFVLGLDLPVTIADLAGATPTIPVNGRSLVPLFSNPASASWRDDFLFEHDQAVYGIRRGQYKYVEYNSGDREFYDLSLDPYELVNQVNNPAYASTIGTLTARLAQLKLE